MTLTIAIDLGSHKIRCRDNYGVSHTFDSVVNFSADGKTMVDAGTSSSTCDHVNADCVYDLMRILSCVGNQNMEMIRNIKKDWTFEVDNNAGADIVSSTVVKANSSSRTQHLLVEVFAFLFESIKKRFCQGKSGQTKVSALISIPCALTNEQGTVLQAAARCFHNVEFMHSSVAAVLSFSNKMDLFTMDRPQRVMTCEIGAGCLNVSLCTVTPEGVTVNYTAGEWFGGIDLTCSLRSLVLEELNQRDREDLLSNKRLLRRFDLHVETQKVQGWPNGGNIVFTYQSDHSPRFELQAGAFHSVVDGLFRKLAGKIQGALNTCGLSFQDLDYIHTCGGSMYISRLKRALSEHSTKIIRTPVQEDVCFGLLLRNRSPQMVRYQEASTRATQEESSAQSSSFQERIQENENQRRVENDTEWENLQLPDFLTPKRLLGMQLDSLQSAELMHLQRILQHSLSKVQAATEDRLDQLEMCVICKERRKQVANVPCGHMTCGECCRAWTSVKKKCPVCRKDCHSTTAVFM